MKRAAKIVFCGVLVSALIAAMGFSRAYADGDDAITIPEFYVFRDSADYCVVRADLDGGNLDSRRKRLLEFIRHSYEETDKWRNKYIVSAVDYVEFRYFYTIAYSKCESSRDVLAGISSFFSICKSDNADGCDIKAAFAPESGSPLVAKFKGSEVPISLFDQFRGRSELLGCVVEIPSRVPTATSELQSLINHLNSVRTKYRMSIIDIYLLNNRFYFLLSRQCDHKSDIISEAEELIESENFHLEDYLGQPNFTPDLSEYIFSETGQR